MTVHRRILGEVSAAPLPSSVFTVRFAGRHLHDPARHSYISSGAPDESPVLSGFLRAWRDAYAEAVEDQAVQPEVLALLTADPEWTWDAAAAIERSCGVTVVRLRRLEGDCALRVGGRSLIVVGTTPNWFFSTWSMVHELGHLVRGDLSADGNAASPRASERAANAFAAELLLPRDRLAAVDWHGLTESELADFVWTSGVSTRALANRLRSLHVDAPDRVTRLLRLSTLSLVRRGSIVAQHPTLLDERVVASEHERLPEGISRRW